MWNIERLSGKGSALQALIVNAKPDALVLSELKALSVGTIRELWPGVNIEAILLSRKNVRSAPRVGMAVVIRLGLQYNLLHVYHKQDKTTNSVLQALSVKFAYGTRLAGTFLSPTTTGTKMTHVLNRNDSQKHGRELILGDLNTRNGIWNRATNQRGRAVITETEGTRYQASDPREQKYTPRGREGFSTPDILLSNIRGVRAEGTGENRWTGESDHLPVCCLSRIREEHPL